MTSSSVYVTLTLKAMFIMALFWKLGEGWSRGISCGLVSV